MKSASISGDPPTIPISVSSIGSTSDEEFHEVRPDEPFENAVSNVKDDRFQ
jgi:hypothetical protein